MSPLTIWPCRPVTKMVNLFGIGGNDAIRKVAETDNMSKWPWKVMVVPGVVDGWRNMTLATVPKVVRTQRSMFLRRQNFKIASTTSFPLATSRMYELIGLFLEPGGWPLGHRTTSIKAPLASCLGFRAGVGPPPLLRLSSSSECCCCYCCCWWWCEVWESVGTWWKGWENGFWRCGEDDAKFTTVEVEFGIVDFLCKSTLLCLTFNSLPFFFFFLSMSELIFVRTLILLCSTFKKSPIY